MIHLYNEFIRSIRVGNIELYTYCLPKIGNLFFAFNHPNYAQWILRYLDNILKLRKTHPIIYEEFKKRLVFLIKNNKIIFCSTNRSYLRTNNKCRCSKPKNWDRFINKFNFRRQRWTDSYFV